MYRFHSKLYQYNLYKNTLKHNLLYATNTTPNLSPPNQTQIIDNEPSTSSSSSKSYVDHELNIPSTKYQSKMPKREPLMKNLFVAKVDKELLAFPEVILRDDMSKLLEENKTITNYFENNLDIEKIHQTQCIPNETIQNLKNLGLFGINAPQTLGGKGYFWSESLLASEIESKCPDIALILLSHRLVLDVLQTFGTDYQKDKYLSKIATGTMIASEAIFEPEVCSDQFFNTKAVYESSDETWLLNGQKSFVVNGLNANLVLILTQTEHLDNAGNITPGITIFLVETTLPGIKIQSTPSSFGFQGTNQCTLLLENVKLKNEHILGKVNEGNEIIQVLIRAQRLRSSLIALGISKKIIKEMTNYCVATKQNNIYLKDMDMISNRLSTLVSKAYTMESMIYFTAGLIDEFDQQDIDMEAAITKIYAMENLWLIASSAMDFIGPKCLQTGQPSEINLRNAAQFYTQSESIESLKLCTALMGLQHAGMEIYKSVTKTRNPLFHPGHVFKNFFQSSNIETPRTKMFLDQELHPSLAAPAQCLEQSIARLQLASEILLSRYGSDIISKHVEMEKLTEISILIYAMFTTLARSSRSYCIGLKLADHEMLTATAICLDAKERIKIIATNISNGPFMTNDNNLNRLSKQIIKSKGYYYEHPLTYNY